MEGNGDKGGLRPGSLAQEGGQQPAQRRGQVGDAVVLEGMNGRLNDAGKGAQGAHRQ